MLVMDYKKFSYLYPELAENWVLKDKWNKALSSFLTPNFGQYMMIGWLIEPKARVFTPTKSITNKYILLMYLLVLPKTRTVRVRVPYPHCTGADRTQISYLRGTGH